MRNPTVVLLGWVFFTYCGDFVPDVVAKKNHDMYEISGVFTAEDQCTFVSNRKISSEYISFIFLKPYQNI